MLKKPLAFVVYPGVSLLELVGNRTYSVPSWNGRRGIRRGTYAVISA
jgi:hypothetical protein